MAEKKQSPEPRKGQFRGKISREAFEKRFRQHFFDPAFGPKQAEIEALAELAWQGYESARKSPRTRKAGPGYADPDYDLSIEWIEARAAVERARVRHDDPAGTSRVLLICGAARNDGTCPGEMSKTFRMVRLAREICEAGGLEVDVLDLSELTSGYDKVIYPCKACVSTSMALCHWPCSCYPNNSLGQVNDWMNEIYPRWVAAHGIMIVTPVYWYQAPAVLKSMIDRMVCADGGNPDPTSTHGKQAKEAKALELAGWPYPRHLAGRSFSVVVHGDAAGSGELRRSLCDWLSDMRLVQAGAAAALDRYVGYYEPYATSHETFDRDHALHEEVRNAARALMAAIQARRGGQRDPGEGLKDPRPK